MKQPYCVPGVAALILLQSLGFAQAVYNTVPTRILGQAVIQQQQLTATAPNLTEGREFYNPQSVVVDTSASPAILYVADTNNNRVLAWNNVSGFTNGSIASLVIGETDFYSTQEQGPGRSSNVAGFTEPTGVAVDSVGNLYVMDNGNNRILRFPKPFAQPPGTPQPDLVIGQTSFEANLPNQGQSTPSDSSLATTNGSSIYQAGLAIDPGGNLWVSDPGNNRVLRFPQSVLTAGAQGPSSNLVLGQATFGTSALPSNTTLAQKNFLAQPTGVAVDPQGHLFVADSSNRVLVWANPSANGQLADRIMGLVASSSSTSATTIGASSFKAPSGIVFVGGAPYVLDTGYNRILGFAPYSQWPAESVSFSPVANIVIGQVGFTSVAPDGGNATANAQTFFAPTGAAATATDLLITDSVNNRVLDFPVSGGSVAASATRVLGQTEFQYGAINLLQGREVFFSGVNTALSTTAITGGGVAVDTSSNPPHLYISDTGNNRILGFKDARRVTTTTVADIVIGQVDLGSNEVDYPFNQPNHPSSAGLFVPQGIAVDSSGNLWVADTGNSRVVRFATPFSTPATAPTGPPAANLVLGQSSLSGPTLTDATARTMSAPYGISIAPGGDVYISDALLNRILVFRKPQTGDFISGQSADVVIGQTDFFSSKAQAATTGLSSPRGIATDSGDRLYVADSGNGRVAIYSGVSTAENNPPTTLSLSGMNAPNSVGVSATGNIWAADTNNNRVLEYPAYDLLPINASPISTLASAGPLNVALDAAGNPIVAEGAANRVSYYYPTMGAANAANFFARYAPAMLTSLSSIGGSQFGPTAAKSSNAGPWPTTLGDVQVLVNGTAAPLMSVSGTQITFQIPSKTALGTAEVDVLRVSTDEVLATGFYPVEATSPALFTTGAGGQGQVVATNDDGTTNSQSHPIKAGHNISLFGTGQGVIPGAPADGTSATGPVPTPTKPLVYLGGTNYVSASNIQYSGLAKGMVGVWEITATVPSNDPPGQVPVFIGLDGNFSSLFDPNNPSGRLTTTIYVTNTQ